MARISQDTFSRRFNMTWKNWTRSEIESIPESRGVYAIIYSDNDWIYVGQSRTSGSGQGMRNRILEHYEGESDQASCIKREVPRRVGYEVISDTTRRNNRESQLIRDYNPTCNK